jgi:hypothetical protein
LKKCEQGCLEGIKAYLDMEIQEWININL